MSTTNLSTTLIPHQTDHVVIDLNAPRPNTLGTVGIVGLGYVGLPTALSFLEAGGRVIGLEISPARLDEIRSQRVDLHPEDVVRLGRHLGRDNLTLTADPARLTDADTIIVCVPTPVTPNLTPDLRALQSACETVVAHARPGQTIVLTSTTYVGCTRDFVAVPLAARGLTPGLDVHVVFSPERIDPGVADHRPEATPRVVGGLTEACTDAAVAVLAATCPTVHRVSSPEAAELTKLLENTFRAVNIALANEISDVARHLGLSAVEVIDAAATKPYGFMPFYPGPGVGGHCIPCDPHYLLWQLKADRVHAPLIDAAMTGIALRPRRVVERIRETLGDAGHALAGARVHIVGIAYKPGVADVRESPALEIIQDLLNAGATVSYDDEWIPSLAIAGRELNSSVPEPGEVELVLVHTRHPGADLSWVTEHRTVLDATFRLDEVSHRVVL